jgi:hypothetical protein
MEISRSANGRQTNSKENLNMHHNKTMKYREPTVQVDGPTYSSREWNTPNTASSINMIKLIIGVPTGLPTYFEISPFCYPCFEILLLKK